MTAPVAQVIAEMEAMGLAGIVAPSALEAACAFVEANRDEVASWLDTAMSVTGACDLVLELASRKD